jgi:hypothetical protein
MDGDEGIALGARYVPPVFATLERDACEEWARDSHSKRW